MGYRENEIATGRERERECGKITLTSVDMHILDNSCN